MRSLVSLFAGVVIIAVLRGVVAGVEPVDEAQLAMDITQEACDAIRLRDVASLERLLAPEFKLVTSSAEVQGITSLKGTSGGNPFEIDVRFTDTLVKEDGQWRLVVSHVTRVPPH